MNLKWTKEEITFLKNNFKNYTYGELKNYINRTEVSIMKKAQAMGLYKIGKSNLDFIEKLNSFSDEICYYLGYVYADGHITKNQYNVVLQIKYVDYLDNVEFFKNLANFNISIQEECEKKSSITGKIYKHKKLISLVLSSKKIKEWFVNYGFINKSFQTPLKLLNKLNDKQRALFFRGFFDGDGCISKTGHQIAYCLDIKHDFLFLNFLNKQYSFKIYNGSAMLLKKKEILEFLDWIYSDYKNNQLGLKRKYNRYINVSR